MKRGKWIMVLFLLGSAMEGAIAQKKWDGEGGDGLWSNERNWYPDGIPLPSDDVLINSQHVAGSFKILLPPGSFTATVNSLSILPNPGDSITIELPVGNTASPCLTMSSAGNAFRIGKGGLFINSSGASAGNAILLNGSFLIENEGRYVHRTQRGNASIVSKLLLNSSTQLGIFEFDVPGSAGYTLSLSGRQYGTLWLSSLAAGKKSYSGSGTSDLRIHGDLFIADSSSLTSSLNSNLYVGSHLNVMGKFSLNPTLADSLSRELVFNGDSTGMEVSGTLNLGNNFRNIMVARGIFQLKSNMFLTNPNLCWKLAPLACMMMDDFSLGGPGKFETDSASTLGIGADGGISGDSSKGNIRMQNLSLHPKTNYVFNGLGAQQTGDRFPHEAASITINKQSGALMLSSSLSVTDSLGLTQGNIITDSSRILVFSGNRISAGQQAFVNGPFRHVATTRKDMLFPVGKAGIFAPLVISKKQVDSSVIQVEYHPQAALAGDSAIAFPVRNVSTNEYWELMKINPADTVENMDVIRLWLGANSTKGIMGQPQLVGLYTGARTWQLLPLYTAEPFPNTIGSIPQQLKSGIYSFGSMYPAALSFESIDLRYQERNGFTKFSWNTNIDETVEKYVVEKCIGMAAFFPMDSIASQNRIGKTNYSHAIRTSSIKGNFIRVRSVGKNGKTIFSNIIFLRGAESGIRLYPNPAKDFIRITPMMQASTFIGILNQAGQRIATNSLLKENGTQINISQLPTGKYSLLLSDDRGQVLLPFMKR